MEIQVKSIDDDNSVETPPISEETILKNQKDIFEAVESTQEPENIDDYVFNKGF